MMNSTWQKWYHSIGIEKVLPFLRLVQGKELVKLRAYTRPITGNASTAASW